MTPVTDQELFDKCLADYQASGHGIGLRFDPHKHDGVPGFFDERAKMARGRIAGARRTFPKMPDIYFDFVDNRRVGAWAWIEKTEKRHFIGYNAGTEHLLIALFCRLLGDRKVLPFLDGAENERADSEIIKALGPDVATVADFQIGVPVDQGRQMLAMWLRHMVADFIVCHEIAHHLHGHCGYRNYHMPLAPLIKLSYPSTPEEADLVMQVQELYADGEAAWTALAHLDLAVHVGERMPEPLNGYEQNPHVALALWLFGMFVFFRVWGNDSLKSNLEEGSHPHWRFRQYMMFDHVEAFVKKSAAAGRPLGKVSNVRDLVARMLNHAEEVMAEVTGQPADSSRFLEWLHPTVYEHQARLITMWKGGLRQAHERFKIGHLPN